LIFAQFLREQIQIIDFFTMLTALVFPVMPLMLQERKYNTGAFQLAGHIRKGSNQKSSHTGNIRFEVARNLGMILRE